MEWLLATMYWTALGGDHTSQDPRCAMITTGPTDLDLRLIRLTYEVAAAESRCAKCGTPIGRRLRLTTQYGGQPPTWTVIVATRCRGWRRHRHTAVVTEASNSLRLGSFLPS
jgi:hypothetical protein